MLGAGVRVGGSSGRRHPRSDLGFFRNCNRGATAARRPRDLADGEREAFRNGRESWNYDHLVRRRSCTHTPYMARHCRRKLVGSLPWGMPTVVVYRQTVRKLRTRW